MSGSVHEVERLGGVIELRAEEGRRKSGEVRASNRGTRDYYR